MHNDPTNDSTGRSRDEHDIAARLEGQARGLELADTPIDVVVRRGRQRQRRRQTTLGLLAVAALAGTTVGAVQLLTRPTAPPHIVAASPSTDVVEPTTTGSTIADGVPISTAPTTSAVQLVDSNLVWNLVDPDSSEALGNMGQSIAGSGPFVAWSTAAGNTPDQPWRPALWRSDDGQSWQQIVDGPSMAFGSIAEWNGRFFAYGTVPSSASIPGVKSDLAVAVSDDGGVSWTTNPLPIDVSELAAMQGVSSVGVSTVAIASGPQGVLVAARVQPNFAWDQLLPTDAQMSGWGLTDEGVEVYAPASCAGTETTAPGFATVAPPAAETTPSGTTPATVATQVSPESATTVLGTVTTTAEIDATTATTTVACSGPVSGPAVAYRLTWAEIGIAPEAGVQVLGNQPILFLSTDGVTFEAVDSPIADDAQTGSDIRLASTDAGFSAWVATYGRADDSVASRLFDSPDGRTWTEGEPAPIEFPDAFSSSGGRLMMSGYSGGGNVIATRAPDGTWTSVSLDELTLPSDGVKVTFGTGAAAIGPTGITAIGWLNIDPIAEMGGVEWTEEGITIRADDSSGNYRFTDAATGVLIGTIEQYSSTTPLIEQSQQDGTYSVRRTDGGPVVATFTPDELATSLFGQVAYGTPPKVFVLHSTDGVNWSRELLDELVGAPVSSTGGIRLTESQVIVAANLTDQLNANGSAKQVLLIGTPRI
jgi:hypothetical protein